MKASTVVTVGLSVLLLIAISVLGFGVGFAESSAFTLKKDGTGTCQPSDPARITAFYGHTVTWTVTNVDCDPQYISLRDFAVVGGGGPKKVVNPDPVDGGPIATNTSATMSGKVTKLDFGSVYKYEIWIGPAANSVVMRRDPDMEIWP